MNIMNNINKPTNLEFCETCGTMLMLGVCRRCNPDTKIESDGNAGIRHRLSEDRAATITAMEARDEAKRNTPKTPLMEVHANGVDYVMGLLISKGISVSVGNGNGEDLVLADGSTVLVRSRSSHGIIPLIRRSLIDLKSDYIIVVTDLVTDEKNVYVMTTSDAKDIGVDRPDNKTGESDYILPRDKLCTFKDNYAVLNGD